TMAFITPFVSRQYAGVYPIKMEPKHSIITEKFYYYRLPYNSSLQLVESPSSSRRSSQRSDRSSRTDSITELRREIAAAKPQPQRMSEGKSLETLVAEKEQRLAELKRKKQQNIRRRHTMTLRKISEQYETRRLTRRRPRRRLRLTSVATPSDGVSPSSSAGSATSAPE
ncbi:hypothetical protein PMAYCL1PPCAC_32629, partial [Pristionchus mayeri]